MKKISPKKSLAKILQKLDIIRKASERYNIDLYSTTKLFKNLELYLNDIYQHFIAVCKVLLYMKQSEIYPIHPLRL